MATNHLQACLDNINAQNNPRYGWLSGFLNQEPGFVRKWIYPFRTGQTRTIVADLFSPSTTTISISRYDKPDDVYEALETRPASAIVRLILVVSMSGVDAKRFKAQVSKTSTTHVKFDTMGSLVASSGLDLSNALATDDELDASIQDNDAPIVTRSRTAGVEGMHPIEGHTSWLLNPDILGSVMSATNLNAGILLRHLDQKEHLVYRRQKQIQQPGAARQDEEVWHDISFGIDQENYVTAMLHIKPQPGLGGKESPPHSTLILLVNEDNCLGIDFNPYASALGQVFQPSYDSLNEMFETMLKSKSEDERGAVLQDPLILAWDYAALLSGKFACQLELYRRRWKIRYEKYANSTAVCGIPETRDIIRKEAIQLSTHIQYIQKSLQSLTKLTSHTQAPNSGLNELIQDFEEMSNRLQSLKSAYDNFIEQQVSKISLADARHTMTEARDLQRLSYLGFIFAPLSLACSFFSTDIEPLGGAAPVWQLAVTSLATIFVSVLILLFLSRKRVLTKAQEVVKGQKSARSILVTHSYAPHIETARVVFTETALWRPDLVT
ncbi:hypothetical protein O1611_g2235 [Lasiodiplodia mahajangana]|uniref:Uncharacterized protein n=1 Tax=Lasiodiplodia mahajangana TaxID=1108764 RepID=A0ACC2JV32_9PEZI|nr:hypothetical protein O1611_g2235 [Lasiodiplodia mahajangana]